MKLFLNHFDIWLGRLVAALMLPLLYLCLFALSVLIFYGLGIRIFEYDAGLSDVDRLEMLLLSLLLLTSYRLFWRGRQQGWSYWRLSKRFFFVTGVVTLVDVLAFTIIVVVLLNKEGEVQANFLYQYHDAQLFFSGVLLVLALYAAGPLPRLFKDKPVENETPLDRSESIDTKEGVNKTEEPETDEDGLSGRGEGFTFKEVNEPELKPQPKENVDPWLSEGVAKNNEFNKGV